MKLLRLACWLVTILATVSAARGQGEVVFQNVNGANRAPVYGPDQADSSLARTGNTTSGLPPGTQTYSGAPLSGSAWSAQLFGAPGSNQPISALVAAYPINTFRTGPAAGFLQILVRAIIPGVPVDSHVATVQVRAWDNSTGLYPYWSNVVAAVAGGEMVLLGESEPVNVYNLGGVGGMYPPGSMTNLLSFNVHFPPPPSNNCPPLLITQPGSQTALVGSGPALSVSAVGSAPLSYQWFKGIAVIPSATNALLQLSDVQTNDSGPYAVQVRNLYGVATSSNAVLTVVPEAPRITLQPVSQVAAQAGNATFTVGAAGTPPLSYQWRKEGAEIPGATNTSYTITNVQKADAGAYSVLVSSPFGSVPSSNAVLTVAYPNLVAWGDNSYGQCNIPLSATNVIDIAAGGAGHTLALRADGTVVGWGSDGVGNPPASATNVVAVACGWVHNLALRADGSVVAWGQNQFGQTLVPATATNVTAIAAGKFFNLALRADGTVVAWGKYSYGGPTNVPANATNIAWIGAGPCQALAMRHDGSVVVWGWDHDLSWGLYWPPATTLPASWKDVQMVAGGYFQNLVLTPGGRVLAWGPQKPKVPTFATNVTSMLAGSDLNVALREDGTVVAWGVSAVTNVPPDATNACAIAAGYRHAVALTGATTPPRILEPVSVGYRPQVSAGNRLPLYVRAAGSQPLHYQWLADGTPVAGSDSPFPQLLASLGTDNVQYQVVVSNPFGSVTSAVAQVTVLPLSSWGENSYGLSEVSPSVTNVTALAAGAFHYLALRGDGTVSGFGRNQNGQATVPPGLANVVGIAAGGDHSLALMGDGMVAAWGRNWDGQTDVPANATNVVAVSAGWAHSLALRNDGTVLAWGNNDYGQTNAQLLPSDLVSVAAGYYHNIGLRSDGTVVTWGWEVPVPAAATNVVAVAAGWEHCLALRADGSIIAWGDNTYGQCLVPAAASDVVAIAAGYYHDLALRADGTIVAWGKPGRALSGTSPAGGFTLIAAGEDYSLAFAGETAPHSQPQRSSLAVHAAARAVLSPLMAGSYPMTFQWYQDGVAVAGATNRSLIVDHLSSAAAGSYVLFATNSAGISASQTFTLNVLSAPSIEGPAVRQNVPIGGSCCLEAKVFGAEPMSYQWRFGGTNVANGSRLSGANAQVLCLTAAETSDAGFYSVVAANSHGCVTGAVAQVVVSEIVAWGDNSCGQLDVPERATDLVGISAGGQHNLALRRDGTAVAWGDNSSGQTDIPAYATNLIGVAAGEKHSLGLRADDTVVAWGDNTYGQTIVPPQATNVVAIAAGKTHSLALRVDGTVVAWGGDSRQTNTPTTISKAVAIAAGGFYSLALQLNGSVVEWGGSPRVPAGISDGIAVSAGGTHALTLTAGGKLLAGGAGFYGQASVPDFASPLLAASAGGDHSLALLADGTVAAWGGNYSGQTDVPAAAFGARTVSAGGAHSLALLGTNSAAPSLSCCQTVPGSGAFVLRINGLSGRGSVLVYGSSNLVDWDLIATYPPVFGQLQILDQPAATQNQRFYRIQEVR